MFKNALGFSIVPHMQRLMSTCGFFAAIMKSEKNIENSDNTLPTGVPIPVLPTDYLKVRPDAWIGGEGSYVCPVDSGWGLWFNWSMNNLKETAVLASVKGMNPLTGMRMDGYKLEKYDGCPTHHTPFSKGGFCAECGFKWPSRNYISNPDPLFIDGFRTPDGNVRQFFFTEDMSKSIPENVIGKEDTVPAFGFCFYSSKDSIKYKESGNRLKGSFPAENYSQYVSPGIFGKAKLRGLYTECMDSSLKSLAIPSEVRYSYCASTSNSSLLETSSTQSLSCLDNLKLFEVGVGAGAKISQDFKIDNRPIDFWKETPSVVMRVYFVFQGEFEKYASYGFHNLEGSNEGYLEGLSVGGSK